MRRHHPTSGRTLRGGAWLVTAALLLASCASTTAAALSANGVPSLSLDAPLTAVACASDGVCASVGASGGANAPTTTGQIRNHRGTWSALRTPSAPVATIDASACATTTCYFAGTQSTGDLVWSLDTTTGRVTSDKGPSAGVVLTALSCVSDVACVALDRDARTRTRWSVTHDGGQTWSAPRTLAWAAGAELALSCVSLVSCVVAATSSTHVVTLRATSDGGQTWRDLGAPSTWTSLRSLVCDPDCVALVTTAQGSSVALESASPSTSSTSTTSSLPATTWSLTPLDFVGTALSCADTHTCLVAGHRATLDAALAQWHDGTLRSVALTYVPTPLTNVACRANVCVAIGVTTLVSLRP